MNRRIILFVMVTVVAVLTLAGTAMASTPTTYAASQGFTATLDATNAGSFSISLMGNSLDFIMSGAGGNQWLGSQSPLSVYNSGTAPFNVYVSADGSPSYMGMTWLGFSDYSPGQDQVRWSLSTYPYCYPYSGMDTSVTDSYAAGFGLLYPSNSMTLYSYLYTGSGITYPGQYGWTGTVYAVPNF